VSEQTTRGTGQNDGSASGSGSKPAREALLEAAARLFAERGPAAVSTREIAAEANVNNGLIHRHFGTKDELLRQTMERLAGEIAAAAASSDEPASLTRFLDATRERSGYWRLLARCLLDGQKIDELQTEFPTMGQIVALVKDLQDKGSVTRDPEPNVLAALLTATALGWMIYEPFLVRAAALPEDDLDGVRHDVRTAMMSVLLGR
jgi:AcrR family transcriptional regulator